MTASDFTGSPRLIRILCMVHAVDLGGVERSAVRLCRALSANAEVTIALGRSERSWPEVAGCRIALAPRSRFPRAALETLWMMWWMCRLIRRDRPDVILCPGNSYTIVAAFLRLWFGTGCPPIVAKISNALKRADMPLLARPFYGLWCRVQGRLIDHFIGMTGAMAREIEQVMDVPAPRVAMIASPLFESDHGAHRTRPVRRTTSGRNFIAIGRLERQKNFPLLVAAFARGAHADDRLTILGEGGDRTRIERAIRRRRLQGRVSLAGHVADVRPALAQADALLLSSDYEGVPAVVLEAMAAGVPVVATDCCASMAEMIDEGRRGQLVQCGNVAALAKAIACPTTLSYDRDRARAYALSHSVDRAATRYLQLFRRLVPGACVIANDNLFVTAWHPDEHAEYRGVRRD